MTYELEKFDMDGQSIGLVNLGALAAEFSRRDYRENPFKVKRAVLFLLNGKGDILLKRLSKKDCLYNGQLHVPIEQYVPAVFGDDIAINEACKEELGFGIRNYVGNDFYGAARESDLERKALVMNVGELHDDRVYVTLPSGRKETRPHITSVFIGYYDGAIRFYQRTEKVSGYEFCSLKEVYEGTTEKPIFTAGQTFTPSFRDLFSRYAHLLRPVEVPPLDELRLQTRVRNVLKKLEIPDLETLLQIREEELLSTPKFGHVLMGDLRNALLKKGFLLKKKKD